MTLNCCKLDGAMRSVLFLRMRTPFSFHFFSSGGGGIMSEVEWNGVEWSVGFVRMCIDVKVAHAYGI